MGQTKTHKSRLGLTEGKSFLLVSHQNRSVKLGLRGKQGRVDTQGHGQLQMAGDVDPCFSMNIGTGMKAIREVFLPARGAKNKGNLIGESESRCSG